MTKNEFFLRAVLAIASTHPIDLSGKTDSIGEIIGKAHMLTDDAGLRAYFD